MRTFYLAISCTTLLMGLLSVSCQRHIQNNDNAVIDEIATDSTTESVVAPVPESNSNLIIRKEKDIIGYWIGDFRNASEDSLYWSKFVSMDEGLAWNRDNKINISINKLEDGRVYGHSVVAGNYRPFEGNYETKDNRYYFAVSEPGDDKYDGKFEFSIAFQDSLLSGSWKAFKNIDIRERKYDLQKKLYRYDPAQMLVYSRRYGNWDKSKKIAYEGEMDEETREMLGDFYLEFESATDSIYKINASENLLSKQQVENLKHGDLFIIRNTIYARHGYSFKNRPLRVFFDAQPWYIPVHNDIKKDLTAIEKQNIKLLMRYEKNAKTYYDTFGRG